MCADAPDTSGMNAAAVEQAQLGRDQLEFFKQLYEDTAPERAAAAARQNQISDAQIGLMRQQQTLTDEANQRYKDKFQPLEDKLVTDAQNFDTPARREAEAAQAQADVGSQISLARQNVQRDLESRGVDASSGNAMVALSKTALGEGAAKAAAGNAARKLVETTGAAKMADAVNLGRGIATSQGTTASLALNAGNASSGNAGQALGTTTSGAGLMQTGFNGAQQGLQGSVNTLGQIGQIQNQASANSSSTFGALGSALGQFAGSSNAAKLGTMVFSDENMKEGIEPVDGDEALEQIALMPVSSWRYKAGSPGDDGGQQHTGPMAQDVRAAAGDRMAPGGKQIDLISMNGLALAGIQELANRTEEMQEQIVALSQRLGMKPANPDAAQEATERGGEEGGEEMGEEGESEGKGYPVVALSARRIVTGSPTPAAKERPPAATTTGSMLGDPEISLSARARQRRAAANA